MRAETREKHKDEDKKGGSKTAFLLGTGGKRALLNQGWALSGRGMEGCTMGFPEKGLAVLGKEDSFEKGKGQELGVKEH